MGRLNELRTHVNYELEMIPDPKTRTSAVAHLYGVSLGACIGSNSLIGALRFSVRGFGRALFSCVYFGKCS